MFFEGREMMKDEGKRKKEDRDHHHQRETPIK
jgi:hypothetical protein